MTYRTRYVGGPAIGVNFGIVVNDETLTWTRNPPSHDIPKAFVGLFSRSGPLGSGKQFEVLPSGRARQVRR